MSNNNIVAYDVSNPASDAATVTVTSVIDCSTVRLRRNFIVAKVSSAKTVLTSGELQRLVDAGYDVEVVTPA